MKVIRLLPLVYIVGVDGFVLFAPYVAMLLTGMYVVRLVRPAPQLAPVSSK